MTQEEYAINLEKFWDELKPDENAQSLKKMYDAAKDEDEKIKCLISFYTHLRALAATIEYIGVHNINIGIEALDKIKSFEHPDSLMLPEDVYDWLTQGDADDMENIIKTLSISFRNSKLLQLIPLLRDRKKEEFVRLCYDVNYSSLAQVCHLRKMNYDKLQNIINNKVDLNEDLKFYTPYDFPFDKEITDGANNFIALIMDPSDPIKSHFFILIFMYFICLSIGKITIIEEKAVNRILLSTQFIDLYKDIVLIMKMDDELCPPLDAKRLPPLWDEITEESVNASEYTYHFPLDEFEGRREGSKHIDYLGLSKEMKEKGPANFERLVNELAKKGYFEDNHDTLQVLTYRLSGYDKPEIIKEIPIKYLNEDRDRSKKHKYPVKNILALISATTEPWTEVSNLDGPGDKSSAKKPRKLDPRYNLGLSFFSWDGKENDMKIVKDYQIQKDLDPEFYEILEKFTTYRLDKYESKKE